MDLMARTEGRVACLRGNVHAEESLQCLFFFQLHIAGYGTYITPIHASRSSSIELLQIHPILTLVPRRRWTVSPRLPLALRLHIPRSPIASLVTCLMCAPCASLMGLGLR